MNKLFYAILTIFLTFSTAATAQTFDENTKYRIATSSGEGALYVDTSWGDPYPTYDNGTGGYSNVDYWYIRKSGKGYTLQNAQTQTYLACIFENWGGQRYASLGMVSADVSDDNRWQIVYNGDNFEITLLSDANYYLRLVSYSEPGGTYTYASLGMLLTDGFEAIRIFTSDGKEVGDYGAKTSVLSSLRINNKQLVGDRSSGSYMFSLPESLRGGGKNFSATVTFDKAADDNSTYIVNVAGNGATRTATGFNIRNISCDNDYELIITKDGEEILRQPLVFTFLPIIEINAGSVNGSTYTDGTFRITDGNTTEHDTAWVAQFKYRGASASNYKKRSFNVKLFTPAGEDLDVNALGLRKDHTWILDAMAIDRIRMRNRVCFDVWNQIDRLPYSSNYNSRNGTVGRFVEVFFNGRYHGLYCFTDKINRKLLNLTKVLLDSTQTHATTRGLLIKGESWGDDTYLKSTSSSTPPVTLTWGGWELKYPDEYPQQSVWVPLRNLISFSKRSEAYFAEHLEEFMHMPNLVNYVTEQLAFNLEDNGMKNMFMSIKNLEKGHQFIFTVWDMDSSLGGLWDGKRHDRTADTTYVTRVYPLSRLFSKNVAGFRDSVRVRWNELKETTLSHDSVMQRINSYKELFKESGAWKREVNRWEGNPVPLADIDTEVQYVSEWYQRNIDYLNTLLPPYTPPSGIGQTAVHPQHKGIYTLDGRKVAGRKLHELPSGIYIVDGKKVMR